MTREYPPLEVLAHRRRRQPLSLPPRDPPNSESSTSGSRARVPDLQGEGEAPGSSSRNRRRASSSGSQGSQNVPWHGPVLTGNDTVQNGYWPLDEEEGNGALTDPSSSSAQGRNSNEDMYARVVRHKRREFHRLASASTPNPLPPDIKIRDYAIDAQPIQLGRGVSGVGNDDLEHAFNEAWEGLGRPDTTAAESPSTRLSGQFCGLVLRGLSSLASVWDWKE